MRNGYSKPKDGNDERRSNAVNFVDIGLQKRIEEENKENERIKDRELKKIEESEKKFNDVLNYENGTEGVEKNIFLALENCKKLADSIDNYSGNLKARNHLPEILFKIAQIYENGSDEYKIKKNLIEAKNIYIESDKYALKYKVDYDEVKKYFSEIFLKLAIAYENGDDECKIEKNPEESNKYLKLAESHYIK